MKKTGTAAVSGITAPAAAFLASSLHDPGSLIVITPDEDSARNFTRDLSLFLGEREALYFPPFESLPYENLTPDVDTTALRVSALAAARLGAGPVVIPAIALLQPTLSPAALAQWKLTIRRGHTLDRDETTGRLAAMGYKREPVASQVGDMAVRGGILDIYSPLTGDPVRVELWGNEVHSLRLYDPETQRSGADLKEHIVLPVTELLLDPDGRSDAEKRLGDFLAAEGIAARERERTLSLLKDGLGLPGAGLFLPLLYSESSYPLDHLSGNSLLLLHEPEEIRASLRGFIDKTSERRANAFPAPEKIYLDPATVLDSIQT